MVKQTVEVYEQGTGKLLETYEIDVAEPEPTLKDEIEDLKQRLKILEKA